MAARAVVDLRRLEQGQEHAGPRMGVHVDG